MFSPTSDDEQDDSSFEVIIKNGGDDLLFDRANDQQETARVLNYDQNKSVSWVAAPAFKPLNNAYKKPIQSSRVHELSNKFGLELQP